jgi:hypothetical protein
VKATTKKIIGALVLVVSGGLLVMTSVSISNVDADSSGGKQSVDGKISVDRFSNTPHYCKAFSGTHGVGTDGVSADFSAALGDVIHANGDDAARTFAMIREKCKEVA